MLCDSQDHPFGTYIHMCRPKCVRMAVMTLRSAIIGSLVACVSRSGLVATCVPPPPPDSLIGVCA